MRLTVCLALFLATCAPIQSTPPQESTPPTASAVRLSIERIPPRAVRLALDNGEHHQIGYNLCNSDLQRRTGTTWTAVTTGDVCTMELRTLNPGADATFEKQLPADVPAGEYRYVTSVESPLGADQIGIASEPFTVR